MNKYSLFLFLFLAFSLTYGQVKQEKEYRVEAEVLPEEAINLITPYLSNARRIRYYKETDGDDVSYEIKFKRDRLFYSVEFAKNGALEDVEFIIKTKDIPEETLDQILKSLEKKHPNFRINKIQQQYPNHNQNTPQVIKHAFQNLLQPYLNYEIIIGTKLAGEYVKYEVTYNSEGNFIGERQVVSSNYDHVLYH